jgi:hypothetical protein
MKRLSNILFSSLAFLFIYATSERAYSDSKWGSHVAAFKALEGESSNAPSLFNKRKRKGKQQPLPVSYTYTADLPVKIVDFSPTQPFIPGVQALRDGVLTDPNPRPGSYGNYTPAKVDFNPAEPVKVDIKLPSVWDTKLKAFHTYWNSGNAIQSGHPTQIYKLYRSDHTWHLSGSFIHRDPSGWIDVVFADSSEVIDAIRIVGGTSTFGVYPDNQGWGDVWGKQWHFEGYYMDVPRPEAAKAKAPFKYTFGMDSYPWDFLKNDSTGADAAGEQWEKCQTFSNMGIKTARFYWWQANGYTRAHGDSIAWEATLNGWKFDSVLEICKRRGIEPDICLMGGSAENYESWPDNNDDPFNPNLGKGRVVSYSNRDDRENPAVYASSVARMAFLASARYGNNSSIADARMGVPWQHTDPFLEDNTIRKGLNLIHYLELVNEPDNTFWDGPNKIYEYFSGRKLAAMASAIKDGDKGKLDVGFGAGVGVGLVGGVKLVLSGLARPSPDQMLGFRDWCIEHRGWIDSAAGIWDCPIDAINYHDYSKDETEQTGHITTALPPEMSGVLDNADRFEQMSKYYFNGIDWWITEFGFDINHYSRFSVQGFSGYSDHEAAGMWYLRTQLTYLTKGVNRMTAYQGFASDSNNGTQFASMALERMDLSSLPSDMKYIVYPAGNYMGQAKKYGDYVFDSLLSSGTHPGDVWCVKMRKPETDSVVYAVWSIEDTVAATKDRFDPCCGVTAMATVDFVEQTGTYNLPVPGVEEVKEMRMASWTMTPTSYTTNSVSSGTYPVSYGSKPVFIEAVESGAPVIPSDIKTKKRRKDIIVIP